MLSAFVDNKEFWTGDDYMWAYRARDYYHLMEPFDYAEYYRRKTCHLHLEGTVYRRPWVYKTLEEVLQNHASDAPNILTYKHDDECRQVWVSELEPVANAARPRWL